MASSTMDGFMVMHGFFDTCHVTSDNKSAPACHSSTCQVYQRGALTHIWSLSASTGVMQARNAASRSVRACCVMFPRAHGVGMGQPDGLPESCSRALR